ncbi:MAG: general secretion pathway protein GspK [Bryobacteraceae bacterium]
MRRRTELPRRGGALLAVLWLTAALAAIAFSIASTVRSETDRTSTQLDSTRAYFLAAGAIERSLAYMEWGARYRNPDGTARFFEPWMRQLRFEFDTGWAVVNIIPENAKLNPNTSPPEELARLMVALGVEPVRAENIAAAIAAWRLGQGAQATGFYEVFSMPGAPSFRPPRASFQGVEELLLVNGVTPELFYGGLEPASQRRPMRRLGLRDCLSVHGSRWAVDVNSAPAPVLAAAGLLEQEIRAIVETRTAAPFRNLQRLRDLGLRPAVSPRLTLGGTQMYTLRATAWLRTADGKPGDLRRTVGALVYLGESGAMRNPVLRWYDWMWEHNDAWISEN